MKTAKIETADFDLVDASLEEGAVVIDKLEDGKLTYKVVDTLFKPEPKLLSETRGYVISDYQGYLEKEWITSLKQKFSIEVNKEVFNSLIR
jgi:peptidyl-prolyl cis-trans isomerase SurA